MCLSLLINTENVLFILYHLFPWYWTEQDALLLEGMKSGTHSGSLSPWVCKIIIRRDLGWLNINKKLQSKQKNLSILILYHMYPLLIKLFS